MSDRTKPPWTDSQHEDLRRMVMLAVDVSRSAETLDTLLDELGVSQATHAHQRQAVGDWLRTNTPTEVLADEIVSRFLPPPRCIL